TRKFSGACNMQIQTEHLEFLCLFGSARFVSHPVVEFTPFRKANDALALPFCTVRKKNLSFRSGENRLRHFGLEKLRVRAAFFGIQSGRANEGKICSNAGENSQCFTSGESSAHFSEF